MLVWDIVFTHGLTAYLCASGCKKVAENGDFKGRFRYPFHCTLTQAAGRFNPFLPSLPHLYLSLTHFI